MNVGIPLGIFVGFLCGAAFTAALAGARKEKALQLSGSILAIPASCFGGGWLTMLFDVDDILSAYVTALAATAIPVSIPAFYFLIVYTNQELTQARADE
jgi:hypothetical protein